MPSSARSLFNEVIAEHHARIERLVEKRGVARLRKVYEESQAEVAAKLKRLVRSGKGNEFTAHQKRIVLAQLTHGQSVVSKRLVGELGDAARDTQRDTLRALSRNLGKLEHKFQGTAPILPVEDVARFQGVIDKRATSLMRRHDSSMSRYGKRNVLAMEKELSKSLLQGESQHEAIDRVVGVMDGQWWEGERIVRTELSWAANATQVDGLTSAREVVPDMMMQWRELVSEDGEPFDDRVGEDSLALHGQVVVPGSMFTCPRATPEGEDVPEALAMEEIAFPPNRPNDRATISPWRRGWEIPGWRFAGGRRIQIG